LESRACPRGPLSSCTLAKATFRLWPLSCHTNAIACSPWGLRRCEHGRTTSMAHQARDQAQAGRQAGRQAGAHAHTRTQARHKQSVRNYQQHPHAIFRETLLYPTQAAMHLVCPQSTTTSKSAHVGAQANARCRMPPAPTSIPSASWMRTRLPTSFCVSSCEARVDMLRAACERSTVQPRGRCCRQTGSNTALSPAECFEFVRTNY